jgi:hypothetical protein
MRILNILLILSLSKGEEYRFDQYALR